MAANPGSGVPIRNTQQSFLMLSLEQSAQLMFGQSDKHQHPAENKLPSMYTMLKQGKLLSKCIKHFMISDDQLFGELMVQKYVKSIMM